jgi:hypothetical protein
MKMKTTYLLTIATLIVISFASSAQTGNLFHGLNAGAFNTGNFNSGFGIHALYQNTGNSNLAFGIEVLQSSRGGFNCAFGNEALNYNVDGELNVAFGTRSLYKNSSGSRNIAIGHRTLQDNQTGNDNTAIGYASLLFNVGNNNTALGSYTPRNLLTGSNNIFIGSETAINLLNGDNNVILGNRVSFSRTPSTSFMAGNDTSRSIVIADGLGTQRIFIARNGNTGIGLGDNVIPANRLDVKGGVVIGRSYTPDGLAQGEIAPTSGLLVEGKVGIGTTSPDNKVEITHGTNGNSGLRFTNLTSDFNNVSVQAQNKFLSVNASGDVVLQKVSNAVESNVFSSSANTMTSSVNGITASAPIVNSISNTINANNQLITTVNGVQSTPITLPSFTDTDAQSLTLTGNILSISNGNSVTLPAQVPQSLSQSGNVITLSNGGGSFTLPTFIDTNTDAQSLSLTGNTLSISNGNSVTLPAQVPQTFAQSGNVITLSNGGGSFTLPTFTQVPQTLSQTGNTITLSNGGGSFTFPSTNVIAGNNTTVTGDGTSTSPFVISALDKSLYADNGTINQATTINNNRIVYMNNSNIWFNGSGSESNGKIYIGSNATYPNATGNYKLFVEGGILTEKVKVALRSTANWADYVFEKDYSLMPLKNVETYINEHKHLPGIDSAEELAKNGLDLAAMQAKHMAKIEELTLYIIEQNKAIEKNNKDILELKQQIKALTANED